MQPAPGRTNGGTFGTPRSFIAGIWRGINRFIGYEQIFIVASSGHKGCLTIMPFMYPDEDKSTPEVQLSEDLSSAKLFQGCRGKRMRVTELYCYLVECPVIYARPQASILFGNKEKAESSKGSRWMDVALLQCLLDILLHGLLFGDGERINFASGHWFTKQDVNGTVTWSVRYLLKGWRNNSCPTSRLRRWSTRW